MFRSWPRFVYRTRPDGRVRFAVVLYTTLQLQYYDLGTGGGNQDLQILLPITEKNNEYNKITCYTKIIKKYHLHRKSIYNLQIM